MELIPTASVNAELRVAQAQSATRTTLTAAQANASANALLTGIRRATPGHLRPSVGPPEVSQQRRSHRQATGECAGHRLLPCRGDQPSLDDTTVDTVTVTNEGTREVPDLVLDDDGKLLAWKWVGTMLPIEQTALNFVKDLQADRWIAARYYLDLEFQKEISPADLERKWSKLERVLGGMKQVKSALVASQGSEQQLVLVTIEFGNVTDNLFVIFNSRGGSSMSTSQRIWSESLA